MSSQTSSLPITEHEMKPVVHLGLNVYRWTWEYQNLFLIECLRPLMVHFRSSVTGARFWFDRFDARGPHIMVLVSVPSVLADRARELMIQRLDEFATAHQELSGVGEQEAERLHRSVGRTTLCAPDREPGLATENSYLLFTQPPGDYPFHLTASWPAEVEERAWTLVDDLAGWTIGRLAAKAGHKPTREAIMWLASLERHLRSSCDDPGGFWRFYAGTLLLSLPQRMRDDPAAVLDALDHAIGERNRGLFAGLWLEEERDGSPWSGLARLVQLVSQPSIGRTATMQFVRELAHWTLKQLCVSVAHEIPLVLYAWSLYLPEDGTNDALREKLA